LCGHKESCHLGRLSAISAQILATLCSQVFWHTLNVIQKINYLIYSMLAVARCLSPLNKMAEKKILISYQEYEKLLAIERKYNEDQGNIFKLIG